MLKAIIEAAAPKAEATYPVLKRGKLTGMIVLFNAPKCGMILEGEDPTKKCRAHQKPCYYSQKWVESGFEVFDGTAKLSNS